MIKVNRLDHIPRFYCPSDEREFTSYYTFGESLTDKSTFNPFTATVKTASAVSGLVPRSSYQFPDGRDDGSPVPFYARRGVDIVEVSTALRKLDVSLKDLVAKAEEFKAWQQAQAAAKGEVTPPAGGVPQAKPTEGGET